MSKKKKKSLIIWPGLAYNSFPTSFLANPMETPLNLLLLSQSNVIICQINHAVNCTRSNVNIYPIPSILSSGARALYYP